MSDSDKGLNLPSQIARTINVLATTRATQSCWEMLGNTERAATYDTLSQETLELLEDLLHQLEKEER